MKKIPLLTLLLTLCASLLMLFPQSIQEWLYFDHSLVAAGNWWLLISGHWIHVDSEHLVWNIAAFVVLASIIEARSKSLLVVSLLAGMICIDLLLFSPFNSVQRYCGLSGVLNTLMGTVIYIYWVETGSKATLLAMLLCLAKIAVEINTGQSIFTNSSWPPYAIAHLAGMLAAPFAIIYYRYRVAFFNQYRSFEMQLILFNRLARRTRGNYEYMVSSE